MDPVVWCQDPVGQDPVGVQQDPVDPVVWCQNPVGQDPVGVQLDPVGQDPAVWCQDPVGVQQDPVCQDPVVWCQDPVGQDPVVWSQDPVGQDPVGVQLDPVGQDPAVWCQDPVGVQQDPVCQDPVVWCQDPVGQDPVVWSQDPVEWCQDPVGVQQDPVGQDPVVWCQDPVGQNPVVRCQNPVVWCQDPVVWCQDPVSQNPVVWCQDPVSQNPVVRCQDSVRLLKPSVPPQPARHFQPNEMRTARRPLEATGTLAYISHAVSLQAGKRISAAYLIVLLLLCCSDLSSSKNTADPYGNDGYSHREMAADWIATAADWHNSRQSQQRCNLYDNQPKPSTPVCGLTSLQPLRYNYPQTQLGDNSEKHLATQLGDNSEKHLGTQRGKNSVTKQLGDRWRKPQTTWSWLRASQYWWPQPNKPDANIIRRHKAKANTSCDACNTPPDLLHVLCKQVTTPQHTTTSILMHCLMCAGGSAATRATVGSITVHTGNIRGQAYDYMPYAGATSAAATSSRRRMDPSLGPLGLNLASGLHGEDTTHMQYLGNVTRAELQPRAPRYIEVPQLKRGNQAAVSATIAKHLEKQGTPAIDGVSCTVNKITIDNIDMYMATYGVRVAAKDVPAILTAHETDPVIVDIHSGLKVEEGRMRCITSEAGAAMGSHTTRAYVQIHAMPSLFSCDSNS
ncbi:hypothetical protein QJQ45_030121 [Haematococcus lacustris]|nr:hypothetical protein QJQ45_030121 [Haematococcus lacustris]